MRLKLALVSSCIGSDSLWGNWF